MQVIKLPQHCNYIGVFLTLRCNMSCSYCIVHHGKFKMKRSMNTSQWIKALERIPSSPTLPITLQGGEPTLHSGFYSIAHSIPNGHVDLLTNGKFKVSEFVSNVSSSKFKRNMHYASIRFSYHDTTPTNSFLAKVSALNIWGYEVGVWGIAIPTGELSQRNKKMGEVCSDLGLDFRLKSFLGYLRGSLYGAYTYPKGLDGGARKVLCRTSELLIAPDGHVFRCHADLYGARNPIGHILDPKLSLGNWLSCTHYRSEEHTSELQSH